MALDDAACIGGATACPLNWFVYGCEYEAGDDAAMGLIGGAWRGEVNAVQLPGDQ